MKFYPMMPHLSPTLSHFLPQFTHFIARLLPRYEALDLDMVVGMRGSTLCGCEAWWEKYGGRVTPSHDEQDGHGSSGALGAYVHGRSELYSHAQPGAIVENADTSRPNSVSAQMRK
jgi:hypothetical protein